MKQLSLTFILLLSAVLAFAQQSPKETATGKSGDAEIKITYGAPSVRGRKVWGDLVPFGAVWRTGANEATTFSVSKDVKINGNDLKAGTYSLYTIPGEKEWTIILNGVPNQWGTVYNKEKDILRFQVTPVKVKPVTEKLKFTVSDKGKVTFNWENLEFSFDVK
jgi:hypothetical protein